MKITIIGSGTCVPSQHRASPCILVQAAGSTILCDTGPGSLRQLLLAGITIADIDMLVYSHFHIDHTADFCPLLFAAKYGQGIARDRDLTVMGPPGLIAWYERLCAVHGHWIVPERFALRWVESGKDCHVFERLTISTVPVVHSGESMAIRFDECGKASMAYSGDTGYCEGIIDICRGTSKSILECSCPEEAMVQGHLTPALAGRIARESGCKSLVLTHIYPVMETHAVLQQVRREYAGPVDIARDLMTFTV